MTLAERRTRRYCSQAIRMLFAGKLSAAGFAAWASRSYAARADRTTAGLLNVVYQWQYIELAKLPLRSKSRHELLLCLMRNRQQDRDMPWRWR